jgi:hypothetical protein
MQTIKEQIYAELLKHGITERIVIDDEAAEFLLNALTDENLAEVKLDDEGALIVEFND